MVKYLFLSVAGSLLVACSTPSPQYYRMNPQELPAAIKACQTSTKVAQLHCSDLQQIAIDINQLAYELQANPQKFGKKIISLQEQLAQQHAQLQQNANNPELKKLIDKNEQQLRERLAIVKWLESPQ